jgi:hypothetical protein
MLLRAVHTRGSSVIRSCVVFDHDGTIVHTYSLVTVEGAAQRPLSEIERRALALAVGRGHDGPNLSVLHIDPDEVQPGVRYRVDPASRELRTEDPEAGTQ